MTVAGEHKKYYLCPTNIHREIMHQGKKIVQPPYLKAGDKVAFVSPAYWVPQEVLSLASEIIKSWGLQPVIGPHTNNLNVNAYAGTAEERAADLLWALHDDSIKAIVCSRGGYGSIHLLGRIPQESFQQHPKWIIGHGDITILLYDIVASGVMCVHGPMAFQIASSQEPATTITRNILFGTLPQFKLPGNPYNRSGHAEGVLVGGNLSSFSTIIGTRYHSSLKSDIILFIEEVEEALHDIDRLFYMLTLQYDFERVKGIILGTFSSIKFDLQYGSVEQMLIAHLHEYDFPICCGFPVGSNSCIPLIEGAPCSLDVTTEEAVLTFNVKGTGQQPFNIETGNPQLLKENEI
ncbi:MAG: LD-carboxypeptidase [Prevotella sp.]|nr:LD-carboxypeptidase [Prevotella sp.]